MTRFAKLSSLTMVSAIVLSACSQAGNSSVAPVSPQIAGQAVSRAAGARDVVKPNTSPYTYVASTPAPGAIAFCPGSEKAVGGGFSNANAGSQTTSSHPAGAYNGSWKSVDSGGGSITSYVVCVAGSAYTTDYQTATWTAPKSGEEAGLIFCSSGYEASGGGFAMTSGTVGGSNPLTPVTSSTPVDWAANGNPNAAASGTAYGICVETSGYTVVANTGATSVTATCPSGDVAIGGGFAPNGDIYSNFLITSSRYNNSHKAWLVTGVNGSGNQLESYAICASNS